MGTKQRTEKCAASFATLMYSYTDVTVFEFEVQSNLYKTALACEQALFLGLTRDLFWARAASGRERIGAGGELGRAWRHH